MVDFHVRLPEFSVTKIQSFIVDRLVRSPDGETLRGGNIVEQEGGRYSQAHEDQGMAQTRLKESNPKKNDSHPDRGPESKPGNRNKCQNSHQASSQVPRITS